MNDLSFDQLPKAVSDLAKKLEHIEQLILQVQAPQRATDKLLTIKEAAEYLKLTVPTVYSKVSKNELPHMKRGKRLYFSQTELLEYLKGGKIKTNSELEKEAEIYLNKMKKGLNRRK